MSTMTIWQKATEEVLSKAGAKAIRRGKPLKVRSSKDLLWYLDHGWEVISHTEPSYAQGEFWWLKAPKE
jgi:hypothetical protein